MSEKETQADRDGLSELIAQSQRTIALKRRDYLHVHGLIDTNIYFVERGSLKIFVLDADEEQIIRFGYQGNLLGALDSFLTGQPSVFYIQAIKKTVLQVIPKSHFERFIEASASNRLLWQRILEDLIVQQIEREIDILTTSPKERYLRVLKRSPRLFQEVPARYIANYLRMSPETLSRLRKP